MPYVIQVNDRLIDEPIDYTRAWDVYTVTVNAVTAVSMSQIFAEPVTVTLTGGPTSDERGVITSTAIS